jgi:hypothetical protein
MAGRRPQKAAGERFAPVSFAPVSVSGFSEDKFVVPLLTEEQSR